MGIIFAGGPAVRNAVVLEAGAGVWKRMMHRLFVRQSGGQRLIGRTPGSTERVSAKAPERASAKVAERIFKA